MVPAQFCLFIAGATLALAAPNTPVQASSTPEWDLSKPLNGFVFQRAKAMSSQTIDKPTLLYSRLVNIKGQSNNHNAVSSLVQMLRTPPSHGQHTYQNISTTGNFSTQYAIQCGWDGAPVWLLLDTESADTWAVQRGFECHGSDGRKHSQAACAFGNPHVKKFQNGPIDGLHFYLKYGSGEKVFGPMGYADISCGGVSVPSQQAGLANYTYWHGNNLTVGILGLAYPSITSAFYGEIGQEAAWNAIQYVPFLTNAVMQGNIDPVFSVALAKNSSGGIIAWGGLPEMQTRTDVYAETDLIIANLIGSAETSWRYSFYTIIPDGIVWGQRMDKTKFPYIVDTGTTMNYLPPPLAEAVANAFQPRAVYLYQWGSYFAPCDAIPPSFAVVISGVEFWLNPADMIYRELVDPMTGYCAIAITSGGSGPYILGDVFLQNVVAVFDVGGAQMRFYGRN
ncbi:Peptidase A1 [Metarhizium album ARSEF 1941]|uniref:Peptidase A1 n=1 Tax=Metarhizium album (strain ARSEF 1941) TaxID=1081103 RepID=A0A0B2WW30_METAS|nr:Peptidase A1 [Metarhizium album ARSEF 1941]KHN97794.1 Peptidase A1 [Metarhizium album ARSEF 1941]